MSLRQGILLVLCLYEQIKWILTFPPILMKRIMNRLAKVAYGTCVNIYMNVSKPSWSFVGKLQKRIKSILIGIFEIRFNLKRFTLFSMCWGEHSHFCFSGHCWASNFIWRLNVDPTFCAIWMVLDELNISSNNEKIFKVKARIEHF